MEWFGFLQVLVGTIVGAVLTLAVQSKLQKSSYRQEAVKWRLSKLEELLKTNYRIKELGFGMDIADTRGLMMRNSELITSLSVNVTLYHPDLKHHANQLTTDILKFQKEMSQRAMAKASEQEISQAFQTNIKNIFSHTDALTEDARHVAATLMAKFN